MQPSPPSSAAQASRQQAIEYVLRITLLLNLTVVVAKLVAGLLTDTLSVVAEAAHSGVDAGNNILALYLARIASKAPDERHPYGHSKFETLGALAVVAFLSVTVFELVRSAVVRLTTGGGDPEATAFVVGVMIVSAIISAGVSHYEQRRGRELRSELLLADAAHTRSDLYSSLAVLVGLGFIALGYPQADAWFTLVVAVLITRAGWDILRTTVPVLVDERAVEPGIIERIAVATPGVVACSDIRSRGREGEVFAELTITVSPELGIREAHEIADDVQQKVASGIGAREVVVHAEPDQEWKPAEPTAVSNTMQDG